MNRSNMFPKIMCTQHPDSVSRYIPIQGEVEEVELKYECDEYMQDCEGKATPCHQNVQTVSKYMGNTDMVPGEKIYITPRVHSASHEFSNTQVITELIHPMKLHC